MSITVLLPAYLQPLAEGRAEVELGSPCATVGEAMRTLARAYPGVYDRVITERGDVRPHINLFVEEESIRFLDGLATPIRDGAHLTILPAVSGG
jgi:molybdopterin synthase sulfur carrier subunit